MNIIFAKHDGSPKTYAFEVPDCMTAYVHKGMDILVDTLHGPAMATTTTGVISGEGALDVALQSGAYEPIKPVLSFMNDMMRRHVEMHALMDIQRTLFHQPG
jgi:hypothetical protein